MLSIDDVIQQIKNIYQTYESSAIELPSGTILISATLNDIFLPFQLNSNLQYPPHAKFDDLIDIVSRVDNKASMIDTRLLCSIQFDFWKSYPYISSINGISIDPLERYKSNHFSQSLFWDMNGNSSATTRFLPITLYTSSCSSKQWDRMEYIKMEDENDVIFSLGSMLDWVFFLQEKSYITIDWAMNVNETSLLYGFIIMIATGNTIEQKTTIHLTYSSLDQLLNNLNDYLEITTCKSFGQYEYERRGWSCSNISTQKPPPISFMDTESMEKSIAQETKQGVQVRQWDTQLVSQSDWDFLSYSDLLILLPKFMQDFDRIALAYPDIEDGPLLDIVDLINKDYQKLSSSRKYLYLQLGKRHRNLQVMEFTLRHLQIKNHFETAIYQECLENPDEADEIRIRYEKEQDAETMHLMREMKLDSNISLNQFLNK